MKKTILLLIVALTSNVFAQKFKDSIVSKKLDETRSYSLYLPDSYEKNKDKRYPILVLLDGDYLFEPFTGAMSYGNYWDDLPEVIIIGINQNTNNERSSDCELTEKGLPTAKSIAFFDFINMELLPVIEKNYRVASMRIIAGHDLTAGFLNLFLYQIDPVFNGYISLSPDIDDTMLDRMPYQLSRFKRPVFYYQSVSDSDPIQSQDAIANLDDSLKTVENPNFYYKYDLIPNSSHYSEVLYSIPNALYHIFGHYKPISNTEYKEKIVILDNDHVSYLTKKYKIIRESYGIDMPIRYSDFKAIETAIITKKDFNALDELSILARKSYPKGMLADYFMAVLSENKGEYKRASRYYLDAFQKNEIGDLTKGMMMEKAAQNKEKGNRKID